MEKYLSIFLTVALFVIGAYGDSSTNAKITCIHGKYQTDIGSAGYTTCHQNSGALPIPRIKQCYLETMKTAEVVKVAPGGQMTIDGAKFSDYATSHSSSDVGKAMGNCSRKPNKDEMYREAARAAQCVFNEVKKTCK